MPVTKNDLITALRLEDAGAVAVIPLASPIGSGLGMINPFAIRTIKSRLSRTRAKLRASLGVPDDEAFGPLAA